jgi:hypothetical protein
MRKILINKPQLDNFIDNIPENLVEEFMATLKK